MLGDSELSYIFSLCDVGQKGYITSSDILSVGSEYGPELGTILSILRLGKGDRLSLSDFIARVNESSEKGNNSLQEEEEEDEEISCLSPPYSFTRPIRRSSTLSSRSSTLGEEEDFEDLDAYEVRYALRKLEDSLSVMKESQLDTRQDLALILESVNRKEGPRRRTTIEREEHEAEIRLLREKYEAELYSQKQCYSQQVSQKIHDLNDSKRRLSEVMDEYSKEKELLFSEVESLKLVNVVLEQKLEFLRDSRSSENDEINRQWRQIQLDKDRLEDEKIEFGFQKLCLATDSEDFQIEKKEFHRYMRTAASPGGLGYSPIDYEDFGSMQSENESLKLSFEESEFSNRELKRLNEEMKTELASAKSEILELKKKMDPLSSKNGIIGQFRDTLQRKKDSKARYTDILNSERQAHLEREQELIKRNEDLSMQLSEVRRRRSQNSDRLKSPPPKCVITEADKEANKQIIFEKKCLSLIIDELRSANQSLTDNLRTLEKEKLRSHLLSLETHEDLILDDDEKHPRPRVFSSASLQPEPMEDPGKKVPPHSKSMNSLNIY